MFRISAVLSGQRVGTIDEARRRISYNEDTVSMVSTLGSFVGVSYEASLMGYSYIIGLL